MCLPPGNRLRFPGLFDSTPPPPCMPADLRALPFCAVRLALRFIQCFSQLSFTPLSLLILRTPPSPLPSAPHPTPPASSTVPLSPHAAPAPAFPSAVSVAPTTSVSSAAATSASTLLSVGGCGPPAPPAAVATSGAVDLPPASPSAGAGVGAGGFASPRAPPELCSALPGTFTASAGYASAGAAISPAIPQSTAGGRLAPVAGPTRHADTTATDFPPGSTAAALPAIAPTSAGAASTTTPLGTTIRGPGGADNMVCCSWRVRDGGAAGPAAGFSVTSAPTDSSGAAAAAPAPAPGGAVVGAYCPTTIGADSPISPRLARVRVASQADTLN